MHKKNETLVALLDQKLLPLFYNENADTSISILKALYDAGIKVVEYTNRGENALDNFKLLRKTADKRMPGMYLGIGTIKSKKWAKKFINEGADFIICPSMNEDVAQVTATAEILWIPGCMTPTEIATAETAGATLIKIFPGNVLGPSYIHGIRELFPNVKFMPTGGVEAEQKNLEAWFSAGVVGVGMGSKLIKKELIDAQDFDGLKTAVAKTLALVKMVSGVR